MTGSSSKRFSRLALLPAVLLLGGCAYFNTFYNAQGYYKDGLKLKEQRQGAQAKTKFEKSIEKSALVISRWPKSRWVDDATFLIGMSYYQMGHYAKATKQFEQLATAFPNSRLLPRTLLYRGLALLKDRDYGVASVVLDDVRKHHPQYRDAAAYHLAEALHDREEYARAVDSLAAFVDRFPRSRYVSPAVELLAGACFRLKRWDEAERWYRRSVQLLRDPQQRARARLFVAAVLLEQDKHEQVVSQVGDVLGRYRELDDQANLLMGRALYELGRRREALETWAKVRGASDDGAEAFFRIGRHHEEGREFLRARAFYDTSRSRRANSDFGVMAVKRLSLLDALAAGDSTGREPAEAKFLLAEVHNLNLGEYDEALRLYQEVRDSFPKSEWAPKALFARAWILRHVKQDSVGTRRELDAVITGYPETEYADESKRWLGMRVPKRKVVEVKPKPETLAVTPDTTKPAPPPTPAPETLAHVPTVPERPGRPGKFPPEPVALEPEAPRPPSRQEEKPRPVEEVPEPVTPPAEDTVLPALPEEKLPAFENVYFDFDRSEITPSYADVLRRSADELKAGSDVVVELVGHCDPRGTVQYNMALGQKRADAVRRFLIDAGVRPEQVRVRSEGEAGRKSAGPAEYWLDRRVEFEVTR